MANVRATFVYDAVAGAFLGEWEDPFSGEKHVGPWRTLCFEGSTRSSKTYSIVQCLVLIACDPKKWGYKKSKVTIRCFRFTLADAKESVFEDVKEVCESFGIGENHVTYNNASGVATFWNGSVIACHATKNLEKLHSLKQDIAYLNEVMGISLESYKQINQRTSWKVLMDWNPSKTKWWVFDMNFDKMHDDVFYHHSTYKMNVENLDAFQISDIEKNDPSDPKNVENGTADEWHWKVYGLGQRCQLEGAIIPANKWCVIPDSEFPERSACLAHGYGLDFGFSKDPTALVECAMNGNTLFVRELVYRRNLDPNTLASLGDEDSLEKIMHELGITDRDIIIADSAATGAISALNRVGFNVLPCFKNNSGSVIKQGISLMRRMKICVTESSTNIQNELENWIWKRGTSGEQLDVPIDKFNHCLVGGTKIKTSRGNVKIKDVVAGDYVLTRRGYRRVLRSWQSGKNKKVFKLTIDNGSRIIGTGNHLVLTLRGFVPIEEVCVGDKVLCLKKKSKPMARRGTGIRIRQEEQTGSISAEETNYSTTTFGKRLLGSAGKALSSITRMAIAKTIPSKILKRSLRKNTWGVDTGLQEQGLNALERICVKLLRKLLNGTKAKKELSGTGSMLSSMGSELQSSSLSTAKRVVKNSLQNATGRSFVQTTANQQCVDDSELITLLNLANSAGKSSKATSISTSGFAVGVVQEKISLRKKASAVYDLTVDGEHEFFANGLLVHNCMDALRYWLFNNADELGRAIFSGNHLRDVEGFEEYEDSYIGYEPVKW